MMGANSKTALLEAVATAIGTSSGSNAEIRHSSSLGGGCINQAWLLDLADGQHFFVKTNPSTALPGLFEQEAAGLRALAVTGAIRVPKVIALGLQPQPFLVLEAIAPGPAPRGFASRFGTAFAELHARGAGSRFGFDADNYLGATTQPNGWHHDWVAFFAEQRLGHQLALAEQNKVASAELQRLGECLRVRLGEILAGSAEPPTLLHGDLWSGNYLCDQAGEAVLIDPAVYYGHREADLAMTQLFGGFEPAFYHAYEQRWPLAPGSHERMEIYKLYHLLNHLNLFGRSYLGSCLATLRRFA